VFPHLRGKADVKTHTFEKLLLSKTLAETPRSSEKTRVENNTYKGLY